MLRVVEYEILRNVSPRGGVPCAVQPQKMPLRIATIMDEQAFIDSGCLIEHNKTIFLEDRVHDWLWHKDQFHYFGHAMCAADQGDVLIIYAIEKVPG